MPIAENIRKNLKSGLTVSLISIPLSVSLAVASGVTPVIGVMTAVWAGLIAAAFGGSHYNIVGPTGALSGIIATFVFSQGIGSVPMLAILAGIIILLAYFFRLERYLILVPSSVIHGFTLGVAFIIGLNQWNAAFGLHGLPSHEKFSENLLESFRHVPDLSLPTFLVFLVFLGGLFLFKRYVPKFPGAIFLAPVGILLGYLGQADIIPLSLETLGMKYGDMGFRLFSAPHFFYSAALLKGALVIALIAILETMLSAKIADGMTKTKHDERKEMFGLGLANVVSGLMGGMPATAALARTSLNIKSGADHKTSAIINAVAVTVISVFLLRFFQFIPMAVIAAILVFVAIQMVETEHFFRFFRFDKSIFVISVIVAFVTVAEDPIVGILLGVVLSLLLSVDKMSRGHFHVRFNRYDEGIVGEHSGDQFRETEENADVLLYSVRGRLCYFNCRAHVSRFEEGLERYKEIILRLREVHFIDIDGIEALNEIISIIEARGQKVALTSIDPAIADLLKEGLESYSRLEKEGMIFSKSEDAVRALGIEPKKE
ncbi:MAG: SulP family inorganic anion transporter [Candidatus Moranbacteria bacterium]|nr:SulP family inorganic anion transporter [Candidatus Moranbacteria bacterium]NTW45943.1 SulP family inorganic anion transporter [Candidatus Moranbacteria bacterium]